MAVSLWELRKRPVPREALATTPTKPARREHEPPACSYRLGTCSRPRTRKSDGSLHSLCALHRDRSIANQSRYDEKKRRERDAALEAHDHERRRQRQLKYKKRLAKRAREKRRKESSTTTAAAGGVLPSFREFTSTLHRAPPETADSASSPRAWLGSFDVDAACSSSAWRDAAVAQFLHHQQTGNDVEGSITTSHGTQ